MEINNVHEDLFFRKKSNELNENYPEELGDKETLWKEIELKLSGKPKKKNRPGIVWSIAASISLLLITVVLLKQKPYEESISHRIETSKSIEELPPNTVFQSDDRNAILYIQEQCSHPENMICESKEFIELKDQLDELNTEMQKVNKQLELFGPDPSLIKAQVNLENHKAFIIKELLQIVRS